MTLTQTIAYLQGAPGSAGVHASSDVLPDATTAVYNRSLLKRSYPYLHHQRFGTQYPLGMRNGQSMIFRRYEKLAQTTVPLTEGVTPDGTALVKRDYVATIKQYGNFMIISDFVDMTHVDPIIQQGVELMGENMGESMDSVYREYLVAGTAVGFSGGANHAAVSAGFFRPLVDTAIRVLRNNEAKPFTPMIPGSTRIASMPLGESYWAICHPDVEHDIKTVDTATSGWDWGKDFIPIEQYSSHGGVLPSEIGKYRNVRFITTTNTKIWGGEGAAGTTVYKNDGTKFDVYACLIFGRDAYAVIPLQRGSGRTIIQKAGGPTDPLEQRNTVGWKSAGCALITNDDWMYRIEHCITL